MGATHNKKKKHTHTQEQKQKKNEGGIYRRGVFANLGAYQKPQGRPGWATHNRKTNTGAKQKKTKGGYRDEVSSQTLVPTRSPKDDQAGPPTTEKQTQEKRRGDIETRCLRKPWCLPEAPRTT